MQSTGARALVALAAIVVLVVGFIVLTGEEDAGEGSADPPVVSTPTETVPESPTAGATDGSETKPGEEKPKPADDLTKIVVAGGAPEGGVAELDYDVGDEVRFAVESDAADEVHVHGYDIEQEVGPGKPTEFAFTADLDGIYEVELHDSAAQIAELTVNP